MSRQKLQNYLRTHRKRSGFSQQELAFLLGYGSGAKVSRHEQFVRQPTLKSGLKYETIFGTSMRELFSGLFDKAEGQVIARAKLLSVRLQKLPANQLTARKLTMLRMIIVAPDIIAENE